MLVLLRRLSEGTLSTAIEGVSNWLDAWKVLWWLELGLPVWLRMWPLAVDATNATSENREDVDLSVTARVTGDDREPMDLDTLNTPAGKLVSVVLAACPSLLEDPDPFAVGKNSRRYRDTVMGATGRSDLIARHRLIEALPYFLQADRDWTKQHLIAPLLSDDAGSLALWRAIARRPHSTDVLKVIGGAMSERAIDRRLGREIRERLVFSLVIESLYAFREEREPRAVPNTRIQQMLRTLDDEVRASAANAIQQFIRELSSTKPPGAAAAPAAADLFRSAAAPFLRQVWPQERSLATPGVSGAFADLPATSRGAFVEAVNAIEHLLVPFECWSMINYGLHGNHGEGNNLGMIDTDFKAEALLRLLNLTIGTSEGAVVPDDLTEALDQIRSAAPELAKNPIYQRLSTAARR